MPELVKMGYVIVSGMALELMLGHINYIDNKGKTIAVLASGGYANTESNKFIYERILKEKGLIVSQFIMEQYQNRLIFAE